jgi:hypothetical protein
MITNDELSRIWKGRLWANSRYYISVTTAYYEAESGPKYLLNAAIKTFN